jgi:hypothetical protein
MPPLCNARPATPLRPANGRGRRVPASLRGPGTACLLSPGTAPGWQGISSRVQQWSEQPCVRPVSAVHATAGHNALRASGPDQNLAFDNALAHVGCPDRRIEPSLSPTAKRGIKRISGVRRALAGHSGPHRRLERRRAELRRSTGPTTGSCRTNIVLSGALGEPAHASCIRTMMPRLPACQPAPNRQLATLPTSARRRHHAPEAGGSYRLSPLDWSRCPTGMLVISEV